MEYNFRDIEKKWQKYWQDSNTYKTNNDFTKPKCYVLDMFPYPSGAGLHVGHPLGYIASDIYSRYKKLKGFNVLHPMGYDAFGLPAEQYAIEHGVHPAISTTENIENFRKQLDNIGFSYDWDREVNTSDPEYYKWTQWIFLELFDSFFNKVENKAQKIEVLTRSFSEVGSTTGIVDANGSFTAAEWNGFSEEEQQKELMHYRLAFCGYGDVNWCEALGTVLANDEVINGFSERGGHPVEKKKLRQWYLRITAYADRLLEGLETVDFSEAMKEMQCNWIGKSQGAEISFRLTPNPSPVGEGNSLTSNPSPVGEGNSLTPNPSPVGEGDSLTPNPSPVGEGDDELRAVTEPYTIRNADIQHWPILKDLSRENRKNNTKAEAKLWEELRNNKTGFKVRRQHCIGNFIIDFAFIKEKLLVEVDGEYHDEPEQSIYDEARTSFLTEKGFSVIRFKNEEVISNPKSIFNKIKFHLENISLKNAPLSDWRGAGGEAPDVPSLTVYTTRPDTIFGVDFMVIAPEHGLVEQITTPKQKEAIATYLAFVKSRSERERMAEKKITGCFTGAYALNPFNKKQIPVWISEYVLAGYGTGAIMAVPCGDERDYKFAKHFNIPITNIIGTHYNGEDANPTKDAILENSDFLNGIVMRDATDIVLNKLETLGVGKRKINYRMRDAAFSRQRYWGEPFPVKWKNGVAYPSNAETLPLLLPHLQEIKPGKHGEGPLATIPAWVEQGWETNTMPGYAGSSWYFLRYMDPKNKNSFCERKISDYWNQVDVYVGGTEHAVGHLLYSRMWTKALYDLGHIGFEEPFKKLLNQGMIQGSSRLVYRIRNTNQFVSFGLKDQYETDSLYVDVNIVDGMELDTLAFTKWKPEYADASFILEEGKYICGALVEKMSKRLFNTVNPDDLVAKYGADTFRMYEMFLGPVEMSKPWDTKGIEGVHRFMRKFWRLFFDELKGKIWTNEKPTAAELKILHKTIKKIEEDTEKFSYNTAVSAFMIAINELTDLKCHKKEILLPIVVLLAPYAPHVTEELYALLLKEDGKETDSVLSAVFPTYNATYLIESSKEYPVSVNGKLRTTLNLALDLVQTDIEKTVLENEIIQKWLDGKPPKKIIFVKGKMINIVV